MDCRIDYIIVFSFIVLCTFVLFVDNYMSQQKRENMKSTNDKTIALYYSSYCGHCINFLPTWTEFANKNNSKIKIKTINCDKEQCNVPGYPTVILYKNDGSELQFNNERTVDALEKFIK